MCVGSRDAYNDAFLALSIFYGIAGTRRGVAHQWQESLDNLERRDVRRVEILEILALELDVLQRSEGGKTREAEKRYNGMNERMGGGGSMRIAMNIDRESVRQGGGQGAEEDWNRSWLLWCEKTR